jgi:acetyl esterase/lipase
MVTLRFATVEAVPTANSLVVLSAVSKDKPGEARGAPRLVFRKRDQSALDDSIRGKANRGWRPAGQAVKLRGKPPMKTKFLLPFILALSGCAAFSEESKRPVNPTPTIANASYGPHERNVLDFWKADSAKPAPVLVFIHGGGFVAGDKSGVLPGEIDHCLAAGISFASINYRYTTQAPYPAPMLDGARAIQFLRSKAAEWNIDPKRIAAYGGSAGAGISMWIAFHDDLAKPDSADPIERQSTRTVFAGSLGGQSSYDPLQIREWLGGHAWEHPAFLPFFAVQSRDEFEKPEVRRLAADASVINHLTKDDPPVFMIYNEPDGPLSQDGAPGTGIHHPKFGHILKEKMDALGIEAVYRHVSDGQSPNPAQHFHEWTKTHLLGSGNKKP